MNSRAFILATAGHVDHGKSALVQALTGIDPDRLPEEKKRGITIDLGFAHLLLRRENQTFDIGVIDVPGHEDFVRNMVAGVGSVDAALLVVAADDGWMPQTSEHLHILTYLGVRRGVVALTKCDLVADTSSVQRDVRQHLAGGILADAPIIPTSVHNGAGIDPLRAALSAQFAQAVPPADIAKPRLSIDRVFTLRGVGTVVTGTLSGGELAVNQHLNVHPTGASSRIRAMHRHGHPVDRAPPGSRVAINLPNLTVYTDGLRDASSIGRGDVLTTLPLERPQRVLDVHLMRLPTAGDRPLRSDTSLWFHHGTAAIRARVRLLDRPMLSAGESALARIRLTEPTLAMVADRFILRDAAQRCTLAGGVVLDEAPRRFDKTGKQRTLLNARAATSLDAHALLQSQLQRDGILDLQQAPLRWRASIDDVCKSVDDLINSAAAVRHDHHLWEIGLWQQSLAAVAAAIDAEHREHPDHPGFSIAAMPAVLARIGVRADHAQCVLAALDCDGFIRRNGHLARKSHHLALPPRLAVAAQQIRAALAEHAFEPPSRKQLTPDDTAYQAMKFLIASKEVLELTPDLVIAANAYAAAVGSVRDYLTVHPAATVSQLKSLLGSNRRVMVPLLERLDRDGITQRNGDLRSLRQPSVAATG